MTPEILHHDLFEMIAGERLGFGCYRTVYRFRPDPENLVLKVADKNPEQNMIEYAVWREIQYADHISKWFAPCVSISPCGFYLLQKRVEPGQKSDYPPRVPSWFTDIKYENFGFIDGQFVCCDYGGLILTNSASSISKLRKVDWK